MKLSDNHTKFIEINSFDQKHDKKKTVNINNNKTNFQ